MIAVQLSQNTYYSNKNISFTKQSEKSGQTVTSKDENPISRKGETMKLIKATFLGGLVLAGKLIWELAKDGDFVLDSLAEYSEKLAKGADKKELEKLKNNIEKQKNKAKSKRIVNTVGAFVALLAAGFCGFALLYTIFNAPKIAYQSKVNAFKKSQEMDVYTKANEAERELYTQLDEKAQNSDNEEKEQLKEQYLKLRNAKNQVPDFVKIKK